MRRLATAVLCALLAGPALSAEGRWDFKVLLDGTPIGTHDFRLGADGAARSDASFAVKLLGLTVYRYRHAASEQWKGNCLSSLDASTDDNGKTLVVKARPDGDALALTTPDGSVELPGCTMTFAYWNPLILKQAKLLNPQTGKLESVRVRDLGLTNVEVRGTSIAAHRWRIEGPPDAIDLWYSASGQWLALESSVSGRKLRYRLE